MERQLREGGAQLERARADAGHQDSSTKQATGKDGVHALHAGCANLLDIAQRKTPDFSGVFRVADTFRYLYMVEVGGSSQHLFLSS